MKKDKQSYDQQPVRNLRKSVPYRTVGGVFAKEKPSPVEYESCNEENAIHLLNFCTDINHIRSQPIRFHYTDENGKKRHHIPDFEVQTKDGTYYVEVKAIENLFEQANLEKYAYIAKQYRKQHKELVFLTNVQLEQKPLFPNVKLLKRYLNHPAPNANKRASKVLEDGPLNITEIQMKAGIGLQEVFQLITHREIYVDITKSLSNFSLVSAKKEWELTFDSILSSTEFGTLLQELSLGRQPTNSRLLSIAQNWRQFDNHDGVFSNIGGFVGQTPLPNELHSPFLRAPNQRRSFAPGEFNKAKVRGAK